MLVLHHAPPGPLQQQGLLGEGCSPNSLCPGCWNGPLGAGIVQSSLKQLYSGLTQNQPQDQKAAHSSFVLPHFSCVQHLLDAFEDIGLKILLSFIVQGIAFTLGKSTLAQIVPYTAFRFTENLFICWIQDLQCLEAKKIWQIPDSLMKLDHKRNSMLRFPYSCSVILRCLILPTRGFCLASGCWLNMHFSCFLTGITSKDQCCISEGKIWWPHLV